MSRRPKCLPVASWLRVEGHACHATQQIVQLDAIARLEVGVYAFGPNPRHLYRAIEVARIGKRYIPRNLPVDTHGLNLPQDARPAAFEHGRDLTSKAEVISMRPGSMCLTGEEWDVPECH